MNWTLSRSTLANALIALGLTRKKTLQASVQNRPDVKECREEWKASQPTLDPTNLVFLDETWSSTALTRTHGHSPQRPATGHAGAARPLKDRDLRGLLVAVQLSGLTAPNVVDGPMTGNTFVA